MESGYTAFGTLECACPGGTQIEGTKCAACPLGTYSGAVGSQTCAACPVGTTTLSLGSLAGGSLISST